MITQIKVEEQIGGVILHLRGQFIGGEETDELRDTLNKLAENEKNKVIINLANVTYLNSTALGILISAHTHFVKRNGQVILCNVSKSIENIFVITKLALVFPMAESIEDAIKKLET